MPSTVRTFASALIGAAAVSAHGYVESFVINGAQYSGYIVTQFPYQSDPPVVAGWATDAKDLGFVAPDAYADPNIVCHLDGANAAGYAEIAAGDNVFIQWNDWPESHRGPVLDYLAPCGAEGCANVDKTSLEFFKISESGLDGADNLIANNFGWMVKIPEDLAAGFYVLRHEIIALHSGQDANGAQNYPQCISLKVTGGASLQPRGIAATEFYKPDDAGIRFNIYQGNTDYPIPGPAMIEAGQLLEQSTSAVVSTASATVGTGSSPSDGSDAPEVPAATSTEAASQPTEVVPPTTTAAATQPTGVVESPSSTSADASVPEVTEKPVCNGRRKAKRSKKNAIKRRSA